MFQLYANKNKLTLKQRETVTSGSVNVYEARFGFSEDWEGLSRTAVFQAAGTLAEVLLGPEGACVVPWEVLQKPGYGLKAGVYGKNAAGETVLPTVWASLGTILEGVPAGGEGARPPTPDLWQQELARKGDRLDYTEAGELGLYAGDKLLNSVLVSGSGGSIIYKFGHGLKQEGVNVSVDAVSDFSGDNTLPMTAAGVQASVGNIEALLATI